MKLSKVKLSLTKYRFKTFQFNIAFKKKVKKIPVEGSMILNMLMKYEFDIEFTPFWMVTVAVPSTVAKTITENAEKVSVSLVLQKGKFKNGLKMDDTERVTWKTALKGDFKVRCHETLMKDATEDELKQIRKEGNAYGEISVITIAIYHKQFIVNAARIVNFVLGNVYPQDIMAFVLANIGVRNVLFSPPAKVKEKTQYALKPMPAKHLLQELQEDLQVHKQGTLIFFDLDRIYVIDKSPKCTAFSPGEFKNTYVVCNAKSKAASQTGGCYLWTEKKCNVVNAVNCIVKDKHGSVVDIVGGKTAHVSDTKVKKTTKNKKKIDRVINSSTNIKEYIQAVRESKRVICVVLTNIDIFMMTPNKQFIVTTDNLEYKNINGKYRITAMTHEFAKEGNYFSIKTTAELRG